MSPGVLAYGSLISDPGKGLTRVIERRIDDEKTPFNVEFARSSRTRGGAPTLTVVESGGSAVRASVLVLIADVDVEQAQNILYTREIRADRETLYKGDGDVRIERLAAFAGIRDVLYARLRPNIEEPTAAQLAELAICSVARAEPGLDGISYLIGLKDAGIQTPLIHEYEAEILRLTGSADLQRALASVRGRTDIP